MARVTWLGGAAAAVLSVLLVAYLAVADEPLALAILGVLLVLALCGWRYVSTTRRRVLAAMGLFDETTSAELLGGPGGPGGPMGASGR